MKQVLSFLSLAAVLPLVSAQAGTFYYDAPSGKDPVAPPPVTSEGGCASEYFDYDFLDLAYRYIDFDDASFNEGHGVSIGLSKTLTECTFVTLGGGWNGVDSNHGPDVDFWSVSAGVGMIFPITDRIHFVGEGGVYYSFEDPGDDDKFGGYLTPTLRVGITKALEAFASATYFIDEDNQFEYSVGSVLRITEALGLKASWSWNDDEQTVGVGLRLAF